MEKDQVDPWEGSLKQVSNSNESFVSKFEDNFIVSSNSDKLPDSAEYLATLEKKLAKIKRGKGDQKSERKELIKSLEESTDSCMYRLLAGDSYLLTEQDALLDTPTSQSLSSKWLRPEQAITVGELVELVKADYLATQAAEQHTETEQGTLRN